MTAEFLLRHRPSSFRMRIPTTTYDGASSSSYQEAIAHFEYPSNHEDDRRKRNGSMLFYAIIVTFLLFLCCYVGGWGLLPPAPPLLLSSTNRDSVILPGNNKMWQKQQQQQQQHDHELFIMMSQQSLESWKAYLQYHGKQLLQLCYAMMIQMPYYIISWSFQSILYDIQNLSWPNRLLSTQPEMCNPLSWYNLTILHEEQYPISSILSWHIIGQDDAIEMMTHALLSHAKQQSQQRSVDDKYKPLVLLAVGEPSTGKRTLLHEFIQHILFHHCSTSHNNNHHHPSPIIPIYGKEWKKPSNTTTTTTASNTAMMTSEMIQQQLFSYIKEKIQQQQQQSYRFIKNHHDIMLYLSDMDYMDPFTLRWLLQQLMMISSSQPNKISNDDDDLSSISCRHVMMIYMTSTTIGNKYILKHLEANDNNLSRADRHHIMNDIHESVQTFFTKIHNNNMIQQQQSQYTPTMLSSRHIWDHIIPFVPITKHTLHDIFL